MKPAGGEQGAAMVEFALVAPLLLLLVLGIAEFGRAYGVQAIVSGAAREGARAMALGNDVGAAQAATRAAAPTLELDDIRVSPAACPASGADATASATVTVTYRMAFVTHLFGDSLTLSGVGVMRCNG